MFTVDFGSLNMTDISVELVIKLSMKARRPNDDLIQSI